MNVCVVGVGLAAVTLSGCGSSASPPPTISIAPARTFAIAGSIPSTVPAANQPVRLRFRITDPSGAAITRYKTGGGPHVGVHLIIVRDDLGLLLHTHPPISPAGQITETVRFPTPGSYRLLVDAYVNLPGQPPNFQLHRTIIVAGARPPAPSLVYNPVVRVDGFTFRMLTPPTITAAQAATVPVTVTDPSGHPAVFQPWFGAIAHAIFFERGTLYYFHTHVCNQTVPACFGAAGVAAGRSDAPGRLNVGVLLPTAGVWRLFLQVQANHQLLTAPFVISAA